MSKALDALKELSLDPSAQELADMREKSRINGLLIRQGAFEEGIEQGIEQGIVENQRKTISLILKKGLSVVEIADLLEMSIEEIEKILK